MVPTDYFYDSADGLRLYCGSARRSGGSPVLCLPSLTRNGRDFVALAARLSELHDVQCGLAWSRTFNVGPGSLPLRHSLLTSRERFAAR
jgi:hypothetical protein